MYKVFEDIDNVCSSLMIEFYTTCNHIWKALLPSIFLLFDHHKPDWSPGKNLLFKFTKLTQTLKIILPNCCCNIESALPWSSHIIGQLNRRHQNDYKFNEAGKAQPQMMENF